MFGWRLIRIDGDSMTPLLRDGDYALARRLRKRDEPQPGDVVLVDHPQFGAIVKCLGRRETEGFPLYGLSPCSTSRARLGYVERGRVIARLRWAIAPQRIFRISGATSLHHYIEEHPCSLP